MATTKPRILLALDYDRYAREYLSHLPPEHFMEAIGQSTQRKITVQSLEVIQATRPEIQVFSELLVQYPHGRDSKPHQVVPDNMVVDHDTLLKVETSFDVPLQPAAPFWVMEYVSKNSKRKDYEDSFSKYEQELKVPYYLLFHPEDQELTLFRHNKRKYVSVKPNAQGRLAIPEIELEMGLLEGWCRFWYHGELLPLTTDLLSDRKQARRERDQEKHRADQEKHRADQEKHRADQEKHRADQEKHRADAAVRELELLRARLKQTRGKRGEE